RTLSTFSEKSFGVFGHFDGSSLTAGGRVATGRGGPTIAGGALAPVVLPATGGTPAPVVDPVVAGDFVPGVPLIADAPGVPVRADALSTTGGVARRANSAPMPSPAMTTATDTHAGCRWKRRFLKRASGPVG